MCPGAKKPWQSEAWAIQSAIQSYDSYCVGILGFHSPNQYEPKDGGESVAKMTGNRSRNREVCEMSENFHPK